jgi:hypothetical protein
MVYLYWPGGTVGVVKIWMIWEFVGGTVILVFRVIPSCCEMLLMNYICSRYFLNYGTETLEEDDAIMHWRYSFSYICTSRLILHGFCNWYCWTHVQGRHVPIYAHLQLRLATCRINQYHNCRPISTSRHIFIDNVFHLSKEKKNIFIDQLPKIGVLFDWLICDDWPGLSLKLSLFVSGCGSARLKGLHKISQNTIINYLYILLWYDSPF